MKELINNLKGDKVIWSFVALLALFSFMPVFSASSNLAYLNQGDGNTISFLLTHLAHIFMGFIIIYAVHKVPYHYFRNISKLALPIVWALLAYTLVKGTVIAGANASRWMKVPFIGITFQTSTLILPANFSTTALIFVMVLMLAFVGKYPLRYIGFIIGSGIVFLVFFIMLSKVFPESHFFSRVGTWSSRIENFTSDKPDEDDYQIEKAKIAIASGGIYGLGPGKSVQKNFLPQSSSDFIYAIIVEEYGLIGGLGVMTIYLLLLFRFIIAAHQANTLFGKLVVVGLGFPMIFQAMTNMAVAVELLPVTGQTLPLISSGGSSIWMTCISLGIIIAVTKKEEEIAEEAKESDRREAILQKLIDEQIAKEDAVEDDFSIIDSTKNPMDAVTNK